MSKRGPEGVRASLRNKADKAFDWVRLSKNLSRSSLCCFFVSIKVSVQTLWLMLMKRVSVGWPHPPNPWAF